MGGGFLGFLFFGFSILLFHIGYEDDTSVFPKGLESFFWGVLQVELSKANVDDSTLDFTIEHVEEI